MKTLFSSIYPIYKDVGLQKISHTFTVPAMNLRGLTYDTAGVIFKVAKKLNAGFFVFEIAKSEMKYTNQSPKKFSSTILKAAKDQNYQGPIFVQGDHFQAKAQSPGIPAEGEIENLKKIIEDSMNNGFYNIDIDCSTLVNLNEKSVEKQQESNIRYTSELISYIKSQPLGVNVSVGAEIGHIGGKNSTLEEFICFMEGLKQNKCEITKISVQTGTSHGGVVLPNGTLANVDIDFTILKKISDYGKKHYQIGGSVQHGASTLPDYFYKHLVDSQTLEVHLATGIQNLIFDHYAFPKDLLKEMYTWLDENCQSECKPDWTTEQFHYKLRKKAWGKFDKDIINIKDKNLILSDLEKKIEFWFTQLNVQNTKEITDRYYD